MLLLHRKVLVRYLTPTAVQNKLHDRYKPGYKHINGSHVQRNIGKKIIDKSYLRCWRNRRTKSCRRKQTPAGRWSRPRRCRTSARRSLLRTRLLRPDRSRSPRSQPTRRQSSLSRELRCSGPSSWSVPCSVLSML